MEVIILYGFICSGKSTIAKEYKNDGYTIVRYDDDEKKFSANLKALMDYKEKIVIDAPIWNANNLAVYSALCGHYGVQSTNVKVYVLPHIELGEVLLRARKRWETDPSHINHAQFKDINHCLEVIESRYKHEYQIITFKFHD